MAAEPYYILRVAKGRAFLQSKNAETYSLVSDRQHADVFCSHVAPIVRDLAERFTGQHYQMVLVGYFHPSDVSQDGRTLN